MVEDNSMRVGVSEVGIATDARCLEGADKA